MPPALIAMPRLLILCEHPTLLGGERSMLATLPAVAAAGFDIQIAAPPAGPLADALHERGISHMRLPMLRDGEQHLLLEPTRAELAKLLQRLSPDLVHANNLSIARISGPVVANAGLRSLGHLRDIVKLSQQAINDLNQHTRLLAVSQATRDAHVQQGLDADRCAVLHNGVDLDELRPRAPTGYLHRELGLPENARLVATIGQLGLRKGTEVVLLAAAIVARELSDIHWLIVGERTSNKEESRNFESELRSMASQPPLAGRVLFLGSRADVSQLMNECTLLVHAARQEPLGRVLLEAAASGLPVVATNVGGTQEIFPTTNDGAILIPPDDPPALAEAMTDILTDESRRESFARSARRRAETAFDIQLAAYELITYCGKLLG
ncbi:MAG: glycosyltransferase family 4 protein [Pirellulales bacterium]